AELKERKQQIKRALRKLNREEKELDEEIRSEAIAKQKYDFTAVATEMDRGSLAKVPDFFHARSVKQSPRVHKSI
ncbi:hypothetical protein ADUPG1_001321, partial [Aduncisulcus paluster]